MKRSQVINGQISIPRRWRWTTIKLTDDQIYFLSFLDRFFFDNDWTKTINFLDLLSDWRVLRSNGAENFVFFNFNFLGEFMTTFFFLKLFLISILETLLFIHKWDRLSCKCSTDSPDVSNRMKVWNFNFNVAINFDNFFFFGWSSPGNVFLIIRPIIAFKY